MNWVDARLVIPRMPATIVMQPDSPDIGFVALTARFLIACVPKPDSMSSFLDVVLQGLGCQ
jgi:hypothetical protein